MLTIDGSDVRSDLLPGGLLARLHTHAQSGVWRTQLVPVAPSWHPLARATVTRRDDSKPDDAMLTQWALEHAAPWEGIAVTIEADPHAAHAQIADAYEGSPEGIAARDAQSERNRQAAALRRREEALAATRWLRHPWYRIDEVKAIPGLREVFWRVRGIRVQVGIVAMEHFTGWSTVPPEWNGTPFQASSGDLAAPYYYETTTDPGVIEAWKRGDEEPVRRIALALLPRIAAGEVADVPRLR